MMTSALKEAIAKKKFREERKEYVLSLQKKNLKVIRESSRSTLKRHKETSLKQTSTRRSTFQA